MAESCPPARSRKSSERCRTPSASAPRSWIAIAPCRSRSAPAPRSWSHCGRGSTAVSVSSCARPGNRHPPSPARGEGWGGDRSKLAQDEVVPMQGRAAHAAQRDLLVTEIEDRVCVHVGGVRHQPIEAQSPAGQVDLIVRPRTGDETLELDIFPVAAVEDVVAATAEQYVVARAAEQDVIALAADQYVVAFTAVESKADHASADTGRFDDVVAREALNDDAVVGSFGTRHVDLRRQSEHRNAG